MKKKKPENDSLAAIKTLIVFFGSMGLILYILAKLGSND
jgi:hypothetical protein